MALQTHINDIMMKRYSKVRGPCTWRLQNTTLDAQCADTSVTRQYMQHMDDTTEAAEKAAPIIWCPGHAMPGRRQHTISQDNFEHVLPAVQAKAMAGGQGSAATLGSKIRVLIP